MSEKHLLHITGVPASGKSTLVEALAGSNEVAEYRWRNTPMFFLNYWPAGVVEVGQMASETNPRRGLDRSTMNLVQFAYPWIKIFQPRLVLMEGARLQARSWYDGVLELGYTYHSVTLAHPDEEEQMRRLLERPGAGPQEESWLQGRKTAVDSWAEYTNAQWYEDWVDAYADLKHTCPVAAALAAGHRLNSPYDALQAKELRENPPGTQPTEA